MKRLTILGIIVCIGLLFAPAAVLGGPPDNPGVLDVNIVNTPVPVDGTVEVYPKSITPVRHDEDVLVNVGAVWTRTTNFYTVPTDKRLIVEHFSCSRLHYPPDILNCGIYFGGAFYYISPAYTPAGASSSNGMLVSTGQAIRLIFEQGETLNAHAEWGMGVPSGRDIYLHFSLGGYLEDAE
jgi:hypothetical protein